MKGSNLSRDALAILGVALGLSYINPFHLSTLSALNTKFQEFYSAGEVKVELSPAEVDAALAARYRESCPAHPFTVKLLSRAPDIMIIEDFLTPAEAQFLINVATPNFADSRVISDDASEVIDKSHRDSQTTYYDLPYDPATNDAHAVIKCIEERAAHFQGNVPVENIENLQAVKYKAGGRFNPHYDWLYEATGGFGLDTSGNRESSFFVYLEANCTGGSTNFPAVDRPLEREWCETLNCVDEGGKQIKTVEVKPKVGRAIFWWNVDAWGDVDEMTLHAGAPLIEGSKIGMNIWTRRRRFR